MSAVQVDELREAVPVHSDLPEWVPPEEPAERARFVRDLSRMIRAIGRPPTQGHWPVLSELPAPIRTAAPRSIWFTLPLAFATAVAVAGVVGTAIGFASALRQLITASVSPPVAAAAAPPAPTLRLVPPLDEEGAAEVAPEVAEVVPVAASPAPRPAALTPVAVAVIEVVEVGESAPVTEVHRAPSVLQTPAAAPSERPTSMGSVVVEAPPALDLRALRRQARKERRKAR